MKKLFFFFALIPFVFTGCEKEFVETAVMEWVSFWCPSPEDPDLILTFGYYKGEEGFRALLKKNDNVVKEEFIPSFKKKVDVGYGVIEEGSGTPYWGLFLKDQIIVVQSLSEKVPVYYASILNNHFKLEKSFEIENAGYNVKFCHWKDNSFLCAMNDIPTSSSKGSVRLYENGNLIRTVRSEKVTIPNATESFIVCGETEFIVYTEEYLRKESFTCSEIWRVEWDSFIKDPSGDTVHKPKVKLSSYALQPDYIEITVQVVYFSGESAEQVYKIDLQSGLVL